MCNGHDLTLHTTLSAGVAIVRPVSRGFERKGEQTAQACANAC